MPKKGKRSNAFFLSSIYYFTSIKSRQYIKIEQRDINNEIRIMQ